jgi:hypothetical protein
MAHPSLLASHTASPSLEQGIAHPIGSETEIWQNYQTVDQFRLLPGC